MRLQIISDIHLEFYYNSITKLQRILDRIPVLADTLMVAGDLFVPHKFFTQVIFKYLCKTWKKVFYVMGNHEFWYAQYPPDTSKRSLIALGKSYPNLSVLHHNVVEYEGRRFLGDTMWFPDFPDNALFRKQMTDFSVIKNFEPWVYVENEFFRSFLQEHLREGDVVMTHHLPSYSCVHEYYKTDPLNRFYVTELGALIAERKPKLWIYGHNHEREDKMLGETRVVSNPKGYPQALVKGFDKGMVVDV